MLIKACNIFLPIFLFMLGVCIGLAPIITAMVVMKAWIFTLLVVSVPLATVIISITNNITEWDNIFTAHDIKNAIKEYQIKKSYNDNQ